MLCTLSEEIKVLSAKRELDSLHLLRQCGSSAEEKRTGQQHLQRLLINYCHSGTLQMVPSFFFNLLPAKK